MQSCFFVLIIVFAKTHKKATRCSKRSYRRYTQLTMTTSNSIFSSQASLPTERKSKGRGNKIVEGAVIKAKIGEMEEEVRAGSSRRVRKELTDVVQGVSGRRMFLVRFQNGWEKNLSLNQLTAVIIEKIPEEKGPEVSEIAEIPEEQVEL